MKALILNSGLGSRMGEMTKLRPKCMTSISEEDTILSRQLKILKKLGIEEVVITTGFLSEAIEEYYQNLSLNLNITFVKNDFYKNTNYIYSIYLAREYLNSDLILMHGDLVFDEEVLRQMIQEGQSCMAVSSELELPEKDFKAVVEKGRVTKVGIEFFENAVAAQPLYVLRQKDWKVWLSEIGNFCESGNTKCYAENALNQISNQCDIRTYDVKNMVCGEIDTQEDLMKMKGHIG